MQTFENTQLKYSKFLNACVRIIGICATCNILLRVGTIQAKVKMY